RQCRAAALGGFHLTPGEEAQEQSHWPQRRGGDRGHGSGLQRPPSHHREGELTVGALSVLLGRSVPTLGALAERGLRCGLRCRRLRDGRYTRLRLLAW